MNQCNLSLLMLSSMLLH